jgi:hypothetical protein
MTHYRPWLGELEAAGHGALHSFTELARLPTRATWPSALIANPYVRPQ